MAYIKLTFGLAAGLLLPPASLWRVRSRSRFIWCIWPASWYHASDSLLSWRPLRRSLWALNPTIILSSLRLALSFTRPWSPTRTQTLDRRRSDCLSSRWCSQDGTLSTQHLLLMEQLDQEWFRRTILEKEVWLRWSPLFCWRFYTLTQF